MKLFCKLQFNFLLTYFVTQNIFAAACCGGGSAAPSIISGDDKAQISISYSMNKVAIDNVDSSGIWRTSSEHQSIQSYKIEGAHLISDLWQAGFAIPVIQRSKQNETYSGISDISVSASYEYLPEWNYNIYKPKGIGFFQLTIPTGKSKADSEVGGLDSRGNGFWAIGLGTLLTKSYQEWDGFSSFEIHHSFEKKINNSNFDGTLQPGLGGTFGIGLGYNLKDYRIGSGITWSYEDPINSINQQNISQAGFVERYATAVASLSYLASDEWSGTFSYSDQTLFGNALNTSLSRGFALQIQRRWGR